MIKTRLTLTCLFLLACASHSWAEDHMHTLNLQDTEIRLLVETISDITGKNFVIDPEVTGKITVISGQPVPEDKIYDLFLSILSVNGFTTETQGDTIKIMQVVHYTTPIELKTKESTSTKVGEVSFDTRCNDCAKCFTDVGALLQHW